MVSVLMFKVLTKIRCTNDYVCLIYVYYLCIIFLIYQVSLSFFNVSIYYQIISFLNTKNNLFVMCILFLLLVINTIKYKNNTCFCIILYTILLNSNNIMENNKMLLFWLTNTNTNININLINGLMLIHPIILYLFYTIYMLYTYYMYSMLHNRSVFFIKNTNKNYFMYINSILILTATILGCWWAEQELSWGGWWSWDFVELLALSFFLYFLIKIHSNKINTIQKILVQVKIQLVLIILSIMSVRFNIINSIHNFISLETQNQYLYYIVVIVLILLLFLSNISTSIKYYKYRTLLICNLYFIYILTFYLVYMYNLLDLNFIKVNLNVHINLKNIYSYFYLCALLIYWLKNKNTNTPNILYIIFFIVFNKNLNFIDITTYFILFVLLSNFFGKNNKIIQTQHILIICFIYLNLYQIYIFDKDYYQYINRNVTLIKSNNYVFVNNYVVFSSCDNNFINLQTYVDYVIEAKTNSQTFNLGIFKNIFEKKLYVGLTLNELYSYNLQQLLQINGFGLFYILLLILIVFYILLFSKIFYILL